MTITAGVSRVASGLLCLHAVAITPAGPMEFVRSSISIASGLPCVTVRSAPAIVFSGPAQRLLTLRPARLPSHHATLSIESSDSFVASAAASIATGWSEPVPGRELPAEVQRLSRRTFSPNNRVKIWLRFTCWLCLRLSFGEPDAAHEVLKAWISANSIKNRIHVELDHQIVAFLIPFLQPSQGTSFVPQSHTHARDPDRGRVACFRRSYVVFETCLPEAASTRPGQSVLQSFDPLRRGGREDFKFHVLLSCFLLFTELLVVHCARPSAPSGIGVQGNDFV